MPTPAIQRLLASQAEAAALIAAQMIRADALGPDDYAAELNAEADQHIGNAAYTPQDAATAYELVH